MIASWTDAIVMALAWGVTLGDFAYLLWAGMEYQMASSLESGIFS